MWGRAAPGPGVSGTIRAPEGGCQGFLAVPPRMECGMFERGVVDNVNRSNRNAQLVRLEFADGGEIVGRLYLAATRSLADELNAAGGFIDFEPEGGERRLFSKAIIRSIVQLEIPNADQLERRHRQMEQGDPFSILGVRRGADRETVRSAYHRLAKLYHPDRFSGTDLPEEVAAYLSTVVRRLNVAYDMIAKSGK
ncbi:MAG: DnaJ domain-containing protein [Rhizobiales bacterium]|nr:DnaJ domain-containing protein [Hyphomicrobiales bacterium]